MKQLRNLRAGLVPARFVTSIGGVAVGVALAAAPLSATSAGTVHAASGAAVASSAAAVAFPGGDGITDFYRARAGRPLWAQSPVAAQQLVALINSAAVDGLNPRRYDLNRLNRALRDLGRDPRAEMVLSSAFVAYAGDLRRAPDLGIIYVDRELKPTAPSARVLLESAAAAPSLEAFVRNMGWMHPTYGQLRQALATGIYREPAQRRMIAINLERARTLPVDKGRYVLVNAAAQRLYMYENGQVVDYMRVVVGKPKHATPMMAAFIRFASLNPYWNVPPDLAQERIAPNVVKGGQAYLKAKGYQVLSSWEDDATVIDPRSVNWNAVAQGRAEVRLRQLPGPANSMGRMKFMFPNDEGIYLHDTPEKELLTEASRLFSGGCIRLEDAPRLGQWLFGTPLKPKGARAEQKVVLNPPVPVYITYMTAVPSGSQLAFFEDIYGRDAVRSTQVARSFAAR
ncbi:MAG TPA: L,D-transpeptidase family protein [Sphingomicrobium sp.]|nr:L,D-transpeptidase family protein [Sphingomicrobium sp.]